MDKNLKDCSLYNLQRWLALVRSKAKVIKETIDYHRASSFESTYYTREEVEQTLLLVSDLSFFDRLILTANSDINDLSFDGSISQLESIDKRLNRIGVAYSINFIEAKVDKLTIVDQAIVDFHGRDFLSQTMLEVDTRFNNNDLFECYSLLSRLTKAVRGLIFENENGDVELKPTFKKVLEKLNYSYEVVTPIWDTPLIDYTIRRFIPNATVSNMGLVLSKNGKTLVYDIALVGDKQ